MPTVGVVDGIRVLLYYNDHPPPHVHARYGEHRAMFAIADGTLLEGRFPRVAARVLQAWIRRHGEELRENWGRVQHEQPPTRIADG